MQAVGLVLCWYFYFKFNIYSLFLQYWYFWKLYQVLYSSITIFVALESRLLLGRKLTRRQWVGILLATSGLLVSALGSGMLDSSVGKLLLVARTELSLGSSTPQLFGILVTLCSTMVYSAIYTIADYLVSSPIPISTQKLSTISGSNTPTLKVDCIQVLYPWWCVYCICPSIPYQTGSI